MQDNLYGVYRGIVVSTKDPTNKKRIRVKVPQVSGNAELEWAESANAGSPIPSVNSIVWVMFNGGYINKPLYIPTEEDLVWTKVTLNTGYTHDGNAEGDVMWTSYTWRGTKYIEWQGGMTVASTGSEGSFAVPNSGVFFTFADTKLRPSSRRTVAVGKNLYSTANYVNNTAKIDFNTTGNCTVVNATNIEHDWISLNGVRYPL